MKIKVFLAAILAMAIVSCNKDNGVAGVSVDGEKVTDFTKAYTAEEIGEGIVVKRGKKNFRKVVVK